MNYAVFQAKQERTTNSENHSDLMGELNLLAYGAYFMESFRKRVAAAGKTMPGRSRDTYRAFPQANRLIDLQISLGTLKARL